MTAEQITTIITSILQGGGILVFLYFYIRGLKKRISSLEGTIQAQDKTLVVMEKRIEETEKVGGIYKNLMADLPADLDNYKAIISRTKDETIIELQNQQEETRKKLADAEKKIKESGNTLKVGANTEEVIARHLKALKKLMASKGEVKADSDLLVVAEFGERTAEEAIPLILSSNTVEEYFAKHGFKLTITENYLMIEARFHRKTTAFDRGLITSKAGGRWFAVFDNELYINETELNNMKAEFLSIKKGTS